MKKWLVVIFLVSAVLNLNAAAFRPFLKSSPAGAIELIDLSRRRTSSSGSSASSGETVTSDSSSIASSSGDRADSLGDAESETFLAADPEKARQYLNFVFNARERAKARVIAHEPAISVASVPSRIVEIPCIIWQRHRASLKDSSEQYYTIVKKVKFSYDASTKELKNAFELRQLLAEYVKEKIKKEVESIYFGIPRVSVLLDSGQVLNLANGARAGEIGFAHALGFGESAESALNYYQVYGPLNIILRAEESKINSLLRLIPFNDGD